MPIGILLSLLHHRFLSSLISSLVQFRCLRSLLAHCIRWLNLNIYRIFVFKIISVFAFRKHTAEPACELRAGGRVRV